MHGQCQTFSRATDVKLQTAMVTITPLLPQCSHNLEQQCPSFFSESSEQEMGEDSGQFSDLTNPFGLFLSL